MAESKNGLRSPGIEVLSMDRQFLGLGNGSWSRVENRADSGSFCSHMKLTRDLDHEIDKLVDCVNHEDIALARIETFWLNRLVGSIFLKANSPRLT